MHVCYISDIIFVADHIINHSPILYFFLTDLFMSTEMCTATIGCNITHARTRRTHRQSNGHTEISAFAF